MSYIISVLSCIRIDFDFYQTEFSDYIYTCKIDYVSKIQFNLGLVEIKTLIKCLKFKCFCISYFYENR